MLSLRPTELKKKLLFLDRLVTEPKMTPSVRSLLRSRAESLFATDAKSTGILRVSGRHYISMICSVTSKSGSTVQPFPRTATGNQLSKIK